MAQNSPASVHLHTVQVNRLIHIARRWYALASLVEPLCATVDPRWERPLTDAKTELLQPVWFVVEMLRPILPTIEPEGLDVAGYVPDVSVRFGLEQGQRLAELAHAATLRSHRVHPGDGRVQLLTAEGGELAGSLEQWHVAARIQPVDAGDGQPDVVAEYGGDAEARHDR
jgi:hypothetical protein